ncbi:MraW methylase family protein isoform 1 [Tripterygium wilfordii]|uniref:MraW methylase family protein isoform 1 n=1 Tax=Tripterygium wilfordii TaxID=458696 RepID=A0A7J7E0B2_TRIWF|nr:ribosomal RNA small subunit methyltransferase H [Tripterygium wilfordii]XP_038719877.1 ribosomal RNA small subunit methyltransferase H [Tripterygium wilfordii]XP_038719879.1 ribosomal RNA small subunit methyltransferase H [Tripterygium wilfordii]KAF5751971.1 MraW methylase family protein isoform 1 [Tripterygium wilfordii]
MAKQVLFSFSPSTPYLAASCFRRCLGSFVPISNGNSSSKRKKKEKEKAFAIAVAAKSRALEKEKRRTRSHKELDDDVVAITNQLQSSSNRSHIPVMLAEVLEVFSWRPILSFVDCTLGAAGHSSAMIKAHPQMKLYVGMDVDPIALDEARTLLHPQLNAYPHLSPHLLLSNFKHIQSVLPPLAPSGIDAILMDLGISSMQVDNPQRGFSVIADGPLDMRMDPQATLKAEDILNSWPDSEVGRILRDYGEESNWYLLQNKIVRARLHGGLHSTSDLAKLIRSVSPGKKAGRQGWIKTATRVFQALRIAVNDELKTLENSLYTCFDSLAPGGRLAVISFHSLEDRIVKQTFLKIIDCNMDDRDGAEETSGGSDSGNIRKDGDKKEAWIRQMIQGRNGIILTKRPITPSEREENFNRRSRSAKLRVIQKHGEL